MNSEHSTNGPLVALIDDEVDITMFLQIALEDNGYRVIAINEAREAIERLAASPPEVIVLDLLMPVMTGVSLYRGIAEHARLKGTPIVILSGLNVSDELPRLFGENGELPLPAAVIGKPIDIEEVLGTLEQIVGRGARLPS